MPSTRSKGQTQPALPFPRRKSCRPASVKPPTPPAAPAAAPDDPPAPGPQKSKPVALGPTSVRLGPGAPPPPPPPPPPPRIPLSPRKRTGDDNGSNLGVGLLGSPPKLGRHGPRASPRKLFDENAENSPRRAPPAAPAPAPPKLGSRAASPAPRHQAALPESPAHSDRKAAGARLFAEKSRYQTVKQALHTAVPERLLSRETERAAIRSFLAERAVGGAPASLYISGAPGTGKTACFNRLLADMKEELHGVQTVVVNCMTLRSSHAIFPLLAQRLGGAAAAPGGHSSASLQKLLTSPGPTVLLVLDEMDQLDSKSQDVLYTVFEWPHLPHSRLCLVGIANALDLTDRILPRLQALPRCRPLLLHFPPYSRQELAAIVQDRLSQTSGDGVLDASAVQFCARKVSAVSGDARKALDICRRAVEIVEADDRKKAVDATTEAKASRVSVPQVARVLSEVYGDRMSSPAGGEGESFPLQQKLLVCCLLLLTRSSKNREVALGKLHEVYSRLCAKRQVGWVCQGECLSLCSLLESRGVFGLRKAKEARLTKVFLKIEERDVENALKDRTLLGSILEAGLP